MERISKSKLKPNMLKIFRQIEKTGEELVITDRGKSVLLIRPYRDNPDKELQELAGSVMRYENPADPVGLNDWELL